MTAATDTEVRNPMPQLEPVPLAELLTRSHDTGPPQQPLVIELRGQDVVALEAAPDNPGVRVVNPDGLVFLPATTSAVPVRDIDRCMGALGRAVAALLHQQEVVARRHAEQLNQQTRQHQLTLDRIRSYAIERHEGNDICRPGLDAFLEHFDMAPYQQNMRVSFTITGSYLAHCTDDDEARDNCTRYLDVDLSDVDDAVEGSCTVDITVDSVTAEPT